VRLEDRATKDLGGTVIESLSRRNWAEVISLVLLFERAIAELMKAVEP
jgi:hypothetical protein